MTHPTLSLALVFALTLGATSLVACDVDLEGDDTDASTLDDGQAFDGTHGFDTTPGADATLSLRPVVRPRATPPATPRSARRAVPTVSAPFTVVLNAPSLATQAVTVAWRRALPTLAATVTEDVARIALDALIEAETAAPSAASAKPRQPLAARWIAWVRDGEAVLAKADPNEGLGEGLDVNWIGGAPTYVASERPHAVELSRAVVADRLPARFRTLIGHPLRLVASSGEVCSATVSGFTLRSSYVFDPMGDGYYSEDGVEPRPDREVLTAKDAWNKGAVSLNATLSPTRGVCDGAHLATDALQPALPLAVKGSLGRGLELRALRAFRATAKYAEAQTMHVEAMRSEYPSQTSIGRWEYHGTSKPTSTRYVDARGGREFVTVSGESYEACGGPGGGLALLFEIVRNGKAAPQLVYMGDVYQTPESLLDVDGDGRYEVVNDAYGGGVYRAAPEGYGEQVLQLLVPDYSNYGCPC